MTIPPDDYSTLKRTKKKSKCKKKRNLKKGLKKRLTAEYWDPFSPGMPEYPREESSPPGGGDIMGPGVPDME